MSKAVENFYLKKIITDEFTKIQQSGKIVRLRSVHQERISAGIAVAVSAVFFFITLFFLPLLSPIFFVIGIFNVIALFSTNNINTIMELAKKYPNVPIAVIIKGELM